MMAHAQTLGHDVDPVPGAADLVRAAADAGIPIAVVTSAALSWTEEVLGPVLGVRDRVQVLVTAEDVATGKPDPAGYAAACRRLGVQPEACLGVEDSASGIRALLGAGVGDVVGVTTTSPAEDLLTAGAQRTIDDLGDPWLTARVSGARRPAP
jgi:sugar-phosphatase